jgi:hypothetical protein
MQLVPARDCFALRESYHSMADLISVEVGAFLFAIIAAEEQSASAEIAAIKLKLDEHRI